jgi:hypothetical protein
MEVRSVEQLVTKMKAIMHQWHDSAREGNDGAAGNTLEDLLEIPENNFRLPDFGEIELKTKKFEGNSALITLFHKEPKPGASVPKLLTSMGWRHAEAGGKYPENEMSFRSTTYGHRVSARGLTIKAEGNRLVLLYDPQKVDRLTVDRTSAFPTYGDWADDIENRNSPHYNDIFPVYYEVADILEDFKAKLSHTLLVLRKTRNVGDKKQFWFEEAYLMKDVRSDNIIPLIEEGSLVIDFDARTGHNHGTKFRIKKDKAHLLFTDFRLME